MKDNYKLNLMKKWKIVWDTNNKKKNPLVTASSIVPLFLENTGMISLQHMFAEEKEKILVMDFKKKWQIRNTEHNCAK